MKKTLFDPLMEKWCFRRLKTGFPTDPAPYARLVQALTTAQALGSTILASRGNLYLIGPHAKDHKYALGKILTQILNTQGYAAIVNWERGCVTMHDARTLWALENCTKLRGDPALNWFPLWNKPDHESVPDEAALLPDFFYFGYTPA